ncbi:MAG: alanine racemase [Nitriliruptoraceae bacterium]
MSRRAAPVHPDHLPVGGLRPTRVEVDLDAIAHNVARLAAAAPEAAICAVVKADAYGHGAVPVARAAVDAGATWLAVALVEEGIELREAGLEARILVLSEPPIAAIGDLIGAELTPTVYREPFIAVLDAHGQARDQPIPVHFKVDTGMGRVGTPPDQWQHQLLQLATASGVEVEGLYTHLARADEPQVDTTAQQLAAFDRAVAQAARLGIRPRLLHAANTAGVLLHPAARRDLVRPGIGVYGLSASGEVDAADHGLQPALRLVSEVSFTKYVAANTPLSYGHRWRAPEDGWVATVPIGYGDGVPRRLTNRAQVLLGGRRRPVVGTITMDQLLVWCADEEPGIGDEVVLLGAGQPAPGGTGAGTSPGFPDRPSSPDTASSPDPASSPIRPDPVEQRIRVEEWADATDTITYEIVTSLTARLPRLYLGGTH